MTNKENLNPQYSIIRITDSHAPQLDVFARLREPQLKHYYEPEPGIFIAESPKVIKLALAAGYQPLAFLAEEKCARSELTELLEVAPAGFTDGSPAGLLGKALSSIPVYVAEEEVLVDITGFKLTRGMLCAMRRKDSEDASDILKTCRRIAILEDVVNPANLGAIIRSAAAMNMDALLLTQGCTDPLYRRAIRVSMGTVFQIPWAYLPENYIDTIKEAGFTTVAMALTSDALDIGNLNFAPDQRIAVILGTEGEGLMDETIAACDYTAIIPMKPGVDSLNVAAASAVVFYVLQARDL